MQEHLELDRVDRIFIFLSLRLFRFAELLKVSEKIQLTILTIVAYSQKFYVNKNTKDYEKADDKTKFYRIKNMCNIFLIKFVSLGVTDIG